MKAEIGRRLWAAHSHALANRLNLRMYQPFSENLYFRISGLYTRAFWDLHES